MIPRFHLPSALAPGAQVMLPEAATHHAIKVLRMQSGDELVLFDGCGGEWRAEIKVGAGRTAHAVLKDFAPRECESPLDITLVQSLPGGDKMDWVVEKCVELGVTAIQPVTSKRSIIRLSAERMTRRVAHWNAIASAACEQCGRNRVPVVAPVLDLPQYLAAAKAENPLRFLLGPELGSSLRAIDRPTRPLHLMIGPEGGWEATEIQAAQAAGFACLQVGPRVLRTETAGMAALAAMQTLWGDF